jgi:hypothetical protein
LFSAHAITPIFDLAEKETGRRATVQDIELARKVMPLAKFLKTVERKSALSRRERLRIIDQALLLLEMNYVHLPLKRAMHAIDPIQQLKLLKFRLETNKPDKMENEAKFHRRLLQIFASLRDLHTLYQLPAPFKNHTAFLPFLLEQYFEKRGTRRIDKYLVTRVVDPYLSADNTSQPAALQFQPGVEVLYWNGIPIQRAIEINGETQAGSNSEARFARGLDNLTVRPLEMSLPPDEDWVDVTYRTRAGKTFTLKMQWLVFNTDEKPTAAMTTKKKRAAIDVKKTKINQFKREFFAPTDISVRKGFEDLFYVESRNIRGRNYGYIRLFSFDIVESDQFVAELKRVITSDGFPQEGLIIDVRGNPGGNIRAGERSLQFFTPRRIKPELFEFINSPLNLEICRRNSEYREWALSIAEAVVTGATYSLGFPVTTEEKCNAFGQIYYGPVILITDALSYSTTDMFAAGFQDNEVGEILGTSDNTGAGGANFWWYDDLRNALGKKSRALFKPLPRRADLIFAMRRSIRVGRRAGRPLEELGVAPDYRHHMTERDLMKRNVDLLNHAARILESRPVYSLSVKAVKGRKKMLTVAAASKVRTSDKDKRISRVDISVDGRPFKSLTARNGAVQRTRIEFRQAKEKINWSVQAFDHKNHLVAACRQLQ